MIAGYRPDRLPWSPRNTHGKIREGRRHRSAAASNTLVTRDHQVSIEQQRLFEGSSACVCRDLRTRATDIHCMCLIAQLGCGRALENITRSCVSIQRALVLPCEQAKPQYGFNVRLAWAITLIANVAQTWPSSRMGAAGICPIWVEISGAPGQTARPLSCSFDTDISYSPTKTKTGLGGVHSAPQWASLWVQSGLAEATGAALCQSANCYADGCGTGQKV